MRRHIPGQPLSSRWTEKEKAYAYAIVNDMAEDPDYLGDRDELRQALAIYADLLMEKHEELMMERSGKEISEISKFLDRMESIEIEIKEGKKVEPVLTAARAVAKMKEPSVEGLLRRDGFDYEADRVKELVQAIEKLDGKPPPFDPQWNCPTHFAGGDPTCPACIAKQPKPL